MVMQPIATQLRRQRTDQRSLSVAATCSSHVIYTSRTRLDNVQLTCNVDGKMNVLWDNGIVSVKVRM